MEENLMLCLKQRQDNSKTSINTDEIEKWRKSGCKRPNAWIYKYVANRKDGILNLNPFLIANGLICEIEDVFFYFFKQPRYQYSVLKICFIDKISFKVKRKYVKHYLLATTEQMLSYKSHAQGHMGFKVIDFGVNWKGVIL